MKVGVVCPYDLGLPGGVQQLTKELTSQLQLLGHEAVLVGAGTSPGSGSNAIGVGESTSVRANQSSAPITLRLSSARQVREALAGVDVVHVHEPFIPLVGWAALGIDKPRVLTFHADPPPWVVTAYRAVFWAKPRITKSVVTAVSRAAAAAIPAEWGEVDIIPNALDVGSYDSDVEKTPQRVAFLGRDDPRKGLDILLRAWPVVVGAHPEAELVVMGVSRDETIPGVSFRGRVSEEDKRRLLASSAIYVAPNTGGESFGIVLAEAMASGSAVVASNLDAFAAVVGDAGVLVPVENEAALAEGVGDLLSDPSERNRLAQVGLERVQQFDWSVVVEQYVRAYDRALRV